MFIAYFRLMSLVFSVCVNDIVHLLYMLLFKTEVFNPAPGDSLSWKVYFQPASAHLPAIFKQSWGAWLAASGVFH